MRPIGPTEMKWVENRDFLNDFIAFAKSFTQFNQIHSWHIQFKYLFLDIALTPADGEIKFRLIIKPTDSHPYLKQLLHPVYF